MLNEFFELQKEIISATTLDFKRYLYEKIDWTPRLFALIGPRGVGKTTLLLQHIKEGFKSPEECLYISVDNVRVTATGLFNIAGDFFKYGGNTLILDEIHKYSEWTKEVKNIYDSFPKAKVILSGSSRLSIVKGKYDLSRRMLFYEMKGLSFREYLELETKRKYSVLSLEEVLKNHIGISTAICSETRVLKYFKEYLKTGYYPFFLEGKEHYEERLNNVLEKTLYEDMTIMFGLKVSSVPILKKLVFLVATSQPFSPNIEKISSQIGISREYVYHYIDFLEKAGVFSQVYPNAGGFKLIRKASKIYPENPNLFNAIAGKEGWSIAKDAVRETFFVNQLKDLKKVFSSEKGDFLVDGKFIFEIGGKNKNFSQIGKASNAFVAADNIEIGEKQKIPLWLIGFLY